MQLRSIVSQLAVTGRQKTGLTRCRLRRDLGAGHGFPYRRPARASVGYQTKLGADTPKQLPVVREELLERMES